jgi:hypothetical protein
MMSKSAARRLATTAIAALSLGSFAVSSSAAGRDAAAPVHSTKAAFVRAADGNCAALGKLIAPLGNPTALPAIVHKLDIVVPAFTMALRAQNELAAPVGEDALVHRWMGSMSRYGSALVELRAAASAGDASAVAKQNAALGTIGAQAAALSKQLGLHVCFQS